MPSLNSVPGQHQITRSCPHTNWKAFLHASPRLSRAELHTVTRPPSSCGSVCGLHSWHLIGAGLCFSKVQEPKEMEWNKRMAEGMKHLPQQAKPLTPQEQLSPLKDFMWKQLLLLKKRTEPTAKCSGKSTVQRSSHVHSLSIQIYNLH